MDYKHGKSIEVSAEHNPQMMCYALGCIQMFDHLYDIDKVQMVMRAKCRFDCTTTTAKKEPPPFSRRRFWTVFFFKFT